MRTFKVKVKGTFPFPMDMLRYDSAHPVGSDDALEIERSIKREADKPTTISLTMHRPPTEGRWLSFGWKVVEVQKYT